MNNVTDRPTRAQLERLLLALARNYRWVWDRPTRDVLARVNRIADAPQGHPLMIVPNLDDGEWSDIVSNGALVDAISCRP